MQNLSPAALSSLPPRVQRPRYDPATVATGILHLGPGAFHRGHQAIYTDDILNAGDRTWGIVAASLHSHTLSHALAAQGGLYCVERSSAAGVSHRIIGALRHARVGQEDPAALVRAMAHPAIRIVSLTITEKGYCLDPARGDLLVAHPAIQHDLAQPALPRSAPGYICAALAQRRAAGTKPFTLLSCDNLARNGQQLKRLLLQFAALQNRDLARYIEECVACPATMVDKIVPATTSADVGRIAAVLGVHDAIPVVGEAFSQWIIEDDFTAGRPDWSASGAIFVRDAAPWETMKLRLLNGAHSSLAWLALLAALPTVGTAMARPEIALFIARLMRDEIAPVLPCPPGADLCAYITDLLARFANPHLQHRTLQIASDSSQKLPQRLLPSIRARLQPGLPFPLLALAIAAWMRCLCGKDDAGGVIEMNDPLAADLQAIALRAGDSTQALVVGLTGVSAIFGTDLPREQRFLDAVTRALEDLRLRGAGPALQRALAGGGA